MNEKNNFEKLMDQYANEMKDEQQQSIRFKIWSTLNIFKYVGVFVDLYVPKMFQFLIGMNDEQNDTPSNQVKNEKPSSLVFGASLESEEE